MENSDRVTRVTRATGNQGGAIARHLLQRGKFIETASVEMTMPEVAAAFSHVLGKPLPISKYRLKPSRIKLARK